MAVSDLYHISHVHRAYDYLGPIRVLWVLMAWHKICVKINKERTVMYTHLTGYRVGRTSQTHSIELYENISRFDPLCTHVYN